MSHVDEARLHAYLDGLERPADGRSGGPADRVAVESHLAACAECRARLAEVREVRERAASLLAVASPAPARQPEFADVLARAGRSVRRRRVMQINRLTALGWAATLVLAAGIGWIARGAIGFTAAPSDRDRTEPVPAETAPSSLRNEGLSAEVQMASEAAEGADTRQQAEVPAAADEMRQDAAPRHRQPETAAPSPEPQEEAEAVVGGVEQDVMRTQEPAREPMALAAQAANVEPATPDSAKAAGDAGRAFPSGAVALEAITVRSGVDLLEAGELVLPQTEWTPSDLATAATHLNHPIRRIPDLPIRSVETGSLYGQPSVRLVQWAGSVPVELIQSAAPVVDELEADSGLADVRRKAEQQTVGSTAVLVRNGLSLILRAPLSADSLRLLAERIP